MTEASSHPAPVLRDDDEVSLLALGSVLLRWRWMIIALGLVGGLVGLWKGLSSTRVYVSTATFIPQGSDGAASGLALAASQFGTRVPSNAGAWQPPVYVELLRSQALLESIVHDTVVVAEEGGRRVMVMDLLEIEAPTPERRTEFAIRALRKIARASENNKLNAVRLSVTTEWPSVSLALAERLVHGVNVFNRETSTSQAAAERQFTEVQAREAAAALREAEDRLQVFLQGNRAIADSPELTFQFERLQRDVALRQQVYTSLVQSREEARIREVRDTPVITMLVAPRLPAVGEPRRSVLKAVVGGVVGGLVGVLIAFVAQEIINTRRAPNEDALEFFQQLQAATPRFLKRWRRY